MTEHYLNNDWETCESCGKDYLSKYGECPECGWNYWLKREDIRVLAFALDYTGASEKALRMGVSKEVLENVKAKLCQI